MKRIEFIAPVESMRGNLGTKQELVYNPNRNRAFDSIRGQLNPALNYDPRLIGCRRSSCGRNYFCVKTKSSVNLTERAVSNMAVMGGTCAIYAAMVNVSSIKNNMDFIYDIYKHGGGFRVFRAYWMGYIRDMLINKQAAVTVRQGLAVLIIENPWVYTGDDFGFHVSNDILVKFWSELGVDGIFFKVNGSVGIAQAGDTFQDVIDGSINILGLSADSNGYVMLGEYYLLNDSGMHLNEADDVIADYNYQTTNEAPE